jgi:hypothetical protein
MLAVAFAAPAVSQEGEEEEVLDCAEVCYQAEERCYAFCDDSDDVGACEATCQEAVDRCLEQCE